MIQQEEQIQLIRKHLGSDVAIDVMENAMKLIEEINQTRLVKENDFIDGVVNCNDVDHNLYINYDGECGVCGGSIKK